MESILIDTLPSLTALLDELVAAQYGPTMLYVDLEGDDLSRHGTLSLMTVLVVPKQTVYLIDVTTLGATAFGTAGAKETTLRNVLESGTYTKVFFDVRNDSDALFSLYGVSVSGVEDIQLMELASRDFSKRCVNGLAKCIDNDTAIDYAKRQQWRNVKEQGRKLFDPARGGSYKVFSERPLKAEVQEYCVQDVTLMPRLREVYRAKLCDAWWRKIEDETLARIRLSQSPGYNGKGRHMALGPTGWTSWQPTLSQRLERSLLVSATAPAEVETPVSPPSNRRAPSMIQEALMEAMTSHRPGDERSDSDNDQYRTYRSVSNRYTRYFDSDDGDRGDWKDLTACDSECGYCGTCPY